MKGGTACRRVIVCSGQYQDNVLAILFEPAENFSRIRALQTLYEPRFQIIGGTSF